MVILGIDPGLADTGFGLIEKQGNKLNLVDYGCVKTKAKTPNEERLLKIYNELEKITKKYKPEIIAVEELFFCKNVKSALAVGQARGVVILLAGKNKLKLTEFTPLQIKQALTTYGKASKDQVQQMVKIILNLKNIPKPDHASDALAAAICCANSI
ncbi:MAG: crossover junction endodeoxyribonuclease RuvC [Patescibacteria group bacterium]|nr:crossover junction endodeoxyribonuclease RuvC [Patescibacteria group bacterium]